MNALFNPGIAYSSYSYFPSAWAAPVYGSWGLSSISSDWMYGSYANPYITPATQTVVIQQPQPVVVEVGSAQPTTSQTIVAYDYSKPIDTTAAPPEPTAAESAQKVFESARESFKADDFGRALSLADQALVQLPSDPVLHEFRALCLFALKRYDEAAAVNYAVLSAGPSWDWATMINLYSSIDVYTDQLRQLENYVKDNPNSAAAQFQLAYIYLAQGSKEAAGKQFGEVVKLQPDDTLSAKLAKTLNPTEEVKEVQRKLSSESVSVPTPAPDGDGTTPAAGGQAAPPPPPEKLQGTWVASPDPKVKIILVLKSGGEFTWAVTQDGRTQTIQGQAGYQDDVLVLGQQEGPPLAGKITYDEGKKSFSFKPPGSAENVPGLNFTAEQDGVPPAVQ
ncbi:tetratricopeptide repeat protein [Schlesneria sp. DSM 10557]|uniref:tetratricopeptide repeat protein n=1 Tax=Schlesneria sp. DSM 10557 TaxID=3044399 RepID=UPI00359FAE3D